MKRWGWIFVLMSCITMAGNAQSFVTPPNVAPPSILQNVGLDQKLGAQVPLDLSFVDDHGNRVTLASYAGSKPLVLSLVYFECPMLCTEVLNGMSRSFQQISLILGRDFDVVTVSINPRETPVLAASKKAKYLENYPHPAEGKAGWHFLTGKEDAIKALAASVGYRYVYDPVTKQYAHPAGIMVLTPEGKVARYLYGVDYRAKDLRLLLVEASDNKIGTAADKILLLCYQYDPTTGGYGLVIMNIMRVAFALMVIVLGVFIGRAIRQDRKKARAATLALQQSTNSQG